MVEEQSVRIEYPNHAGGHARERGHARETCGCRGGRQHEPGDALSVRHAIAIPVWRDNAITVWRDHAIALWPDDAIPVWHDDACHITFGL